MAVKKIITAAVSFIILTSIALASAQKAPIERVILISLDSMNNSYIFNEWHNKDYKLTPNVGELIRNGASFTRAQTALPSLTQINHLTMVCGCYSDKIGFAGNEGYDPSKKGPIAFRFPWKEPDMIKCDTIFKAMERENPDYTTAVVAGKDFVGCPIWADYTIGPACMSDSMKKDFPDIHNFPEVAGWDSPDAWVMGNALKVLEKKDPDMLFLHFGFIDPAQHNFGNGSAGAWAAVEWADHQVGRLIEYLKNSGKLATTLFVLTSDHGQSNLWKPIDLHDLLVDEAEIGVKFVHAGPLAYVFLEDPADAERAAEFLEARPEIDGVWYGDGLDDIHIRTPYTGDVVVSFRPPYTGSVFRAMGVHLPDISIGAHGAISQSYVPIIFAGPGIRRGVILDDDGTAEADATLADITPTIAALTGFPAPDDVQGRVLPVSQPVELDAPVVGRSQVLGPELTPHLLDEQPRKCSLTVIIFCIISLACLLAICMTKGPEKRYGFPQSLLAVVAIALATTAVLFMQFVELYGSVPGIWPDQYFMIRFPRVYGTPIVAHTLVQLASWAVMWIFYGSILCMLGKILTKSPTGCHLKAFPSYMTPLAWTLIALAVFYRLWDVPFYCVRPTFHYVYLAGLGLSFIKMFLGVKRIEGAPTGGSLLATGIVAALYLGGIWLMFNVKTLTFVFGAVTMYPLGTH